MNWRNWIHAILASIFISVSCLVYVSCDQPDDDPVVEKEASIKVVPSEPTPFSASGGELTLNLTANVDWMVTDVPQWLTVTPDSGAGSNYKQPLVITVAPNEGGLREAVLKFVAKDASVSVKFTQNHGFGPDAPANAVFYEAFTSSIGQFEIEDVKVPQELKCVWEFSSQYKCMKATAFNNPSNYESESWLISPEINLSGVSASYLTFEHAGGYFGTASKEATVWVSKNGGEWEQLVIDNADYPTSWTFITAGNWDLSSYADSKIKIAFKYSSSAKKAGTWEVRNVAILSGTPTDSNTPAVDPTKTAWMEMPATDDENLEYHAHQFQMNGKTYRNYSYGWSQKDLVSVWIAYPLSEDYLKKNVDRTDAWNYDPYLGSEKSSAPFSGFAGDYARGHQLPSADRLCSKQANNQTFYGTNIAPQLNEHNEGIWANIENYVRNTVAAKSDTTYVVTGCVVEGSQIIEKDSDGKDITVPVAFYKAVLRYKKGDAAEWAGMAFYTEHKNYAGANSDLKAVAVSIDDLEEKTGFDFFVNLIDKIGKDEAEAIEAQDPKDVALWNLK